MARKNKYQVESLKSGWGSFVIPMVFSVEAVDRKSAVEVAILTAFLNRDLGMYSDFEVAKKLKPDDPKAGWPVRTIRTTPDPSHAIKLDEIWNTGAAYSHNHVLFVCVDTSDVPKPLVKPWPNTEFRDWVRTSVRHFLALDDAEVLADQAEEVGLSDVADLVRHEVKKMRALRVER